MKRSPVTTFALIATILLTLSASVASVTAAPAQDFGFFTAGQFPLYVSDVTDDVVHQVDASGTTSTYATGFNNPVGLAFDGDGDRIGVMHAGRLEQLDTPETCFRSPASRFVAEFLGDAAFLPGQRTAQGANTALGQVTIEGDTAGAHHQVDVLVRPDDLGITASTPGNAAIVWARYEGESRLYGVELDDGSRLKVRANHACHFLPGARVTVQIIANHSLAAFVHS